MEHLDPAGISWILSQQFYPCLYIQLPDFRLSYKPTNMFLLY